MMPRLYVGPCMCLPRLLHIVCTTFDDTDKAYLFFIACTLFFNTYCVWLNFTTSQGGQYGNNVWSMSPAYITEDFKRAFEPEHMPQQFWLLPTMGLIVYKIYMLVFVEQVCREWGLRRR